MLPCICSVKDHRWRQNVVRTNKWHTRRSWACHWVCLYFKIFQHNVKAGLLPHLCPAFILHEIYDRFKMKQLHWLLCVAKNRDWSRKIMPLSIAPCWMKTYSESRIELPNLQILKIMLEKSSQFLSPEQPCEPKSLDVALKITGAEKIPLENLWLRST